MDPIFLSYYLSKNRIKYKRKYSNKQGCFFLRIHPGTQWPPKQPRRYWSCKWQLQNYGIVFKYSLTYWFKADNNLKYHQNFLLWFFLNKIAAILSRNVLWKFDLSYIIVCTSCKVNIERVILKLFKGCNSRDWFMSVKLRSLPAGLVMRIFAF